MFSMVSTIKRSEDMYRLGTSNITVCEVHEITPPTPYNPQLHTLFIAREILMKASNIENDLFWESWQFRNTYSQKCLFTWNVLKAPKLVKKFFKTQVTFSQILHRPFLWYIGITQEICIWQDVFRAPRGLPKYRCPHFVRVWLEGLGNNICEFLLTHMTSSLEARWLIDNCVMVTAHCHTLKARCPSCFEIIGNWYSICVLIKLYLKKIWFSVNAHLFYFDIYLIIFIMVTVMYCHL